METKKRRPKGTGSVHQRRTGLWCGQVHLGWAGGKRNRRTIYGRNREEIEQAVARILARPEDEREALILRHNATVTGTWSDLLIEADTRGTHTAEAWAAKLAAVGCCIYCGSDGPLTLDHAVPLSRGGDNSLANVVPACFPCNASKGADTAYEFIRRLLTA